MKNKILFIIMLFLYLSIPSIILFKPELFDYKFYILTIFGVLIYVLMRLFGVSNEDLGFKKENFLRAIKHNLPFIVLFVLIVIVFKIMKLNKYTPDETILFFTFYVFISCPIQEFLYRGIFGFFENNLIKNKYIIILLSSFCYSFVHIMYKDILTCAITFLVGIAWYILYRKDYNLSGVALSHIVLGILTISLGIIN